MRDALPAILQEIADAVEAATGDPRAGLSAALAVAAARGGPRVWIPRKPGPRHWLTLAAGEAAAAAIGAHYATVQGAHIELPASPAGSYLAEQRRRARLIGDAIRANLPANEIAARAGITRRAVLKAKAKARTRRAGDQRSLFDETG